MRRDKILKLFIIGLILCVSLNANNDRENYLHKKAVERALLKKKECNNGYMESCYAVAYKYSIGSGVNKDYKKANEFYKKACDGGMYASCATLGSKYIAGIGVRQNYIKANSLFSMACNGKNPYGCTRLAESYTIGRGANKDMTKVEHIYKKSCVDSGKIRNGRHYGCWELAEFYFKQDKHKAKEEYGKLCNIGYEYGCEKYSNIIESMLYLKQDKSKMKEEYGKLCDMGYQQGCDQYRVLNEQGVE